MTPDERKARGQRAQTFMTEFLKPAIEDIQATYTARLIEVSTTEHNKDVRAGKQHSISVAIKVLQQMDSLVRGHILDGGIAEKELRKATVKTEMTDARRRLLDIA